MKQKNKSKSFAQQVVLPVAEKKAITAKKASKELGKPVTRWYQADFSHPTELTDLRKKVFLDRYAQKDVDGNRIEEMPEQMWESGTNE